MTNKVAFLGFRDHGTWSGGSDGVSGEVSLEHIAHEVCSSIVVGPDNNRPNGVTTTGGRPPRPHSRHSPHLHSLILTHPFHPGGAQNLSSDPVPLFYPSPTDGRFCAFWVFQFDCNSRASSLVPLPHPLPQFLSFFPKI